MDLSLCTHLAVGAHQDDLEVMAGHGILECLENSENHFVGVTCTNGAGSARAGDFAGTTDEEMIQIRHAEQEASAKVGEYLAIHQLGFSSSDIKSQKNAELVDQLVGLIEKAKPKIIYTHNPMDKHKTHVAVTFHLIEALRQSNYKPSQLIGCEVWRGLDWLSDESKVVLPISDPSKIKKLIALHKSQVAGGKAYDEATVGRMLANATFFESHSVDQNQYQWFGVDLMPLIDNKNLTLREFSEQHIGDFKNEVIANLSF